MIAPISRVLLLCIVFFVLHVTGTAQVLWDGEGGDGKWTTAANWAGNVVPSSTDNVILDNSRVTVNYIVTLPSGTAAVTIKSLTITPATGLRIEVLLPVTNILTGSPAFIINGPGYGLLINAGGVFRNASGATSGNTVDIADSIRINNGGRYSHNTPRSHASLVAILSKAPGTETGIFEFDVPGSTSFIPSLPGRTYGTLILSAVTAGGNRTYSASGVQNVLVRGDLIIGSGVTCSISLGGNFSIKGNLIQNGGMFNIANNAENTTITLEGNLVQQAGTITETGTALPVIQLNGTVGQAILAAGTVTGSISLRINNAAGITLQSPLSLPYKLELVNGKINTTTANLLTLQSGCSIAADSLSNNSFINGPLRKEGLNAAPHFLFPIGKETTMRWLALRNATGSFTVEFIKGSPQIISTHYTTGIDHISGLEYWSIYAEATPVPSANVELSFVDPNSGGITNMSSLRVAAYSGANWLDGGNTTWTGTPGSRGSVISGLLNQFALAPLYFSLASSDAASNPLPSKWRQFNIHTQHELARLNWTIADDVRASHFDILLSADNRHYKTVASVNARPGPGNYLFTDKLLNTGICYYRVCMVEEDGTKTYSKIIPVLLTSSGLQLSVYPTLVQDHCWVQVSAREESRIEIDIINTMGQVVKSVRQTIQPEVNTIRLETAGLPKGVYMLQVFNKNEKLKPVRFVKQ